MTAGPQADAARQRPLRAFDGYPRTAAVTAAVGISTAGILFVLSEASPSTATFFRCLYALPLLWWLMRREDAAFGSRTARARVWALVAGVFFAGDLLLFHHAILLMGAGLATVLVNLQVVIVTVAAWLIWGERPGLAQVLAVPIALAGVVFISGLLDAEPYGKDPLLGSVLAILTAVCYAGYLLLLRKGRDRQRAAGPIFDATITCGLTALAAGLIVGDFDAVPSLPTHAWLLLLALTAQVGGPVMIATALPRLPAATTSLILLIQPVLATVIAMVVLAESPSPPQLLGVALILGGVLLGSVRPRAGRPH
ncbi:MAG: DMT family transporter [Candidatus Limnocylindrales bacterium]